MGSQSSAIAVVASGTTLASTPAVPLVTAQAAAAGSVLGVTPQAATFLALSSAAESSILGMSAATLGAGAIVIIAVVGLGTLGYWLYTRLRQSQENAEPIIEQVQVPNALLLNQLEPEYDGPNIPDFQPIEMSVVQFDALLGFTQSYFNTRAEEFTCFVSRQIMREPCLMRCCKNLERTDRWAEKVILQHEIRRVSKCPMCQNEADDTSIIFDDDKYEKILGFRQRLLKTYRGLSQGQKRHWRIMIDGQFGNGYTTNHLDNHPLNQQQ